MSKEKILFIVDSFPILSETFIVNQMVGLINLGYDIRIFSNRNDRVEKLHSVIKEYDLLNKTYYNNIEKPSNKYKRIFLALKLIFINFDRVQWSILLKSLNVIKYKKKAINLDIFYKSIYFILNKMPSVIHAHFGHNGVSFVELKELKIIPSKVKIVVTFHGYDLMPYKEKYYNNRYKLLFKKVDVFTVNSLYLKNILKKIVPNINNVELLPVGPNLKLFTINKPIIKREKDVLNITYCGRLIHLKGGHLVIEIAKVLKEKTIGFKINIIGEGELMDKLQQKVKDYNLEDFVKFYGGVAQEYIKEIFKMSHLFLLPGIEDEITQRAETQGLVIQEAQAVGLPVLVSDVGGMKYGMIDGKTGFVLPQKNIKAFVDKIIYLNTNEDIRYRMGENGIRYVQNNFNQHKLTKDLLDNVYKI